MAANSVMTHRNVGVLTIAAVEARTNTHTQDALADFNLILERCKRDRDCGRTDVAVVRKRTRAAVRVDTKPLAQQVGVALADLMHDVMVHPNFPVEIVATVLPRSFGEIKPSDHQAMGVCAHTIEITDAKLVVLCCTPCNPAD